MREKLLLLLSLVAVAAIFALALQLALSWFAPGFYTPYAGWWLVDLLAYAISMTTLIAAAGLFGRYLSPTPPSLDALRAAMLATMAGVVGGMMLVFAGLSALLGGELTLQLATMAFLFGLIPSLFSWLLSPALINLIYGCKHDPVLQEVVNRIAARSGMKPPKAMVCSMREPNAFAYSSPLFGRYVAVTEGLLQLARGEELEAVIGHELGHHKHKDNVVMLVFGLIPSVIYFLGRYLMYAGVHASRYRYDGSRSRRNGGGGLILMLAGVALMVVSVIIQLVVLALSRLREHYADAHGAKVSSPGAMISALQGLDSFYRTYRTARAKVDSSKLKMLFIYALADPFVSLEELFASHPPIPKRIAFLRSLSRVM
ncbi:MAG: zinc metalloprotease HtpX [Thermofilaceae archaeon]|nr:zinc metalloprotease HtpX [Thermofilaceae archaeon]MCX8180064.1 zinc metalloprotease HtpX [Thermofilaceae archaeon]MDW8003194.1 zinc metalloprotease HtpX [Thermofilaceae archaeon]